MNIIDTIFGGPRKAAPANPPAAPSAPSTTPPPPPAETPPAHNTPPAVDATGGEFKFTVKVPEPPKGRLYASHPRAMLKPEMLAAVVRRAGMSIVTPEERSEIEAAAAEFDRLNGIIANLTFERARAAVQVQEAAALESLTSGGDPQMLRLANRTEAKEAFTRAKRLVRAERNKIIPKLAPVAERIAARFVEAAGRVHDKMEGEERALAAEFGVTFHPSPALVVCGQLSWRIAELLPDVDGFAASNPKVLLAFCDIQK